MHNDHHPAPRTSASVQEAASDERRPSIRITNRQRLGWQLRATRVLAGLLRQAISEQLPPIMWTIGNAGATVTGKCYAHTEADQRQAFQAWVPLRAGFHDQCR